MRTTGKREYLAPEMRVLCLKAEGQLLTASGDSEYSVTNINAQFFSSEEEW